jgi:hypothetical protein
MIQPTQKKYTFPTDDERHIAVCIAIQKIGKASIQEIIDFINNKLNSKITEKQVIKCAENLRVRRLLSIDLSEKDSNGLSIKRYLMKSIKLVIPEGAQFMDLVHDPDLKPLIDELDKSKGTHKKGMKTYDYYCVEVEFDTKGRIQGFEPDEEGISRHYKDEEGNVIIRDYCFKNWFRDNLPLINRNPNFIGDIYFNDGKVISNSPLIIDERYVTNIDSGFSGSRGTGGRGTRKSECLPLGAKIITRFSFQRQQIDPLKVQKMFDVICTHAKGFGANHKLSTGRLINPKVSMVEEAIWDDED